MLISGIFYLGKPIFLFVEVIEIVGVIVIILVIAVAVILLIWKYIKPPGQDSTGLGQLCLELIKNGCNETLVGLETVTEVCDKNNMDLDTCKAYCGCA